MRDVLCIVNRVEGRFHQKKKSGYGNSYWVLLWQKIPNVNL